jgi:signal transduction histidine kinase
MLRQWACVSKLLIATSLFAWVALDLSASESTGATEPLRLTQLDHKVWTTRDGAPTPIFGIAQDHEGILWLATSSGLYLFDGLQFKAFRAPVGEPDFPAGAYFSVLVAGNGDVWAGSLLRGIARIRHGRVSFFDEDRGFPSLTVEEIKEGPDGSIWAVVRGRLMVFDGNQWSDAGAVRGLANERGVRAVFFDHEGTQWVATDQAIYYRPRDQQKFSRADTNLGRTDGASNFAESKNGELWIAVARSNPTGCDLLQIDVPGHRVSSPVAIHLPSFAFRIAFASDGSLWVSSSELNRFEPVLINGKEKFLRETFGPAEGLTAPDTLAIFEDRSGDMWLGTPNGIERFQNPVLIKYVDRPLLDRLNIGLARDADGTIWIGNTRTPLLSVLRGQTQEHGPPLSHVITTLFPDAHGAVWIETSDGIVREAHDRLSKVDLPEGIPAWAPRQFFQIQPGELDAFIGTRGVIRLVDGKWSKLEMPGQPKEPPLSFFVDRQDRIWIGYVSGKVGMVEKATGYVFPVGRDADLGSVDTFLESSEGFLCGGMNGIAIFKERHFEVLPSADRAAITGISGMVQTTNGDLWLNGLHGVSRIAASDFRAAVSNNRPLTTELYTQTEITGPAQNFGFPTAVSDASGQIWFNTSGVIAYVDPEHIPHNPLPPTLVISGIEADGQAVGEWNQVRPRTSTIRIPYFGANLFAPEKVKYMYWLHGVDKTWQDVGRRTEAVYTHLGPGKYFFEVKATNGEGIWGAPVSTSLTVLPAFYQTAWFVVLCAIAGVLLLWLGLAVRVRYLTAGIEQLAEGRADERVRIARELHDTLLQGVQGLLLTFHVAAQKVPPDHESKRALERALTMADQIIVEGRNRVNRLRTENVTDAELKSLIQGVAENLRSVAPIDFALERTGGSDTLRTHVVDEVFFIAREALTNAFRHSGASRIVVELDYQDREFRMSCRDNGRGFDADAFCATKSNGHWGLHGMKERAQSIGAKLALMSASDKGTEVHIIMPARLAYCRHHRFENFLKRTAA